MRGGYGGGGPRGVRFLSLKEKAGRREAPGLGRRACSDQAVPSAVTAKGAVSPFPEPRGGLCPPALPGGPGVNAGPALLAVPGVGLLPGLLLPPAPSGLCAQRFAGHSLALLHVGCWDAWEVQCLLPIRGSGPLPPVWPQQPLCQHRASALELWAPSRSPETGHTAGCALHLVVLAASLASQQSWGCRRGYLGCFHFGVFEALSSTISVPPTTLAVSPFHCRDWPCSQASKEGSELQGIFCLRPPQGAPRPTLGPPVLSLVWLWGLSQGG